MRLIDADALIKHLEEEVNECGDYDLDKPIAYGTMLGLKGGIAFAQAMPTVDIKTEVAREIFEDIETLLMMRMGVREVLAELKNKYTKEGVGE